MPKKTVKKQKKVKKTAEKTIKEEIIGEHGKVFFSWEFPEFVKYQRTKGWYLGAGAITLGLLIYAIISTNFLFALVVIMMVLVFSLHQKGGRIIKFQITEDGIEVGSRFYDYRDIENFWIIYEPPEIKTLYFEPKGIFRPRLPIPLEDQNPVRIREVLLQYLSEDLDRENEPVSDQISRLFKL